MRRVVRFGVLAGLVLAAALPAGATTYTYKVKHRHAIGGCEGELIITDNEVRYETANKPDARQWTYDQLKSVQRAGARRLTLYTYEDLTVQLGRDRPFDFEFLGGRLSDEVFSFLTARAGRRGTTPPPAPPPGGRYELAAKHLHTFGGCEGTLKISDTHIEYTTRTSRDARIFKYLDIKRLENRGTFFLDIYTYEDEWWLMGRDKIFRFELKEALDRPVFEFMRARLTQ